MALRPRIYYSAEQKAEIWDRWQRGESMCSIGRLFDRPSSSMFNQLAPTGGIRPLTGRRALYFENQVSIGIVDFSENKAQEFLRKLTEHACRADFQLRHHWQKGDAVLWDNRRVLHAGTPYDVENSRRLMRCTTLARNRKHRIRVAAFSAGQKTWGGSQPRVNG
jgi:alpha-ketoglutarate-dependent taurine dioxygenase